MSEFEFLEDDEQVVSAGSAPTWNGNFHIGRGWKGNEIENNCPCEISEKCGLVTIVDPECVEHQKHKNMRQMHAADQCGVPEEQQGWQRNSRNSRW